MNSQGASGAGSSERARITRYPWMSGEDAAILRQMPPVMAYEYARHLHNEANASRSFAVRTSLLPGDALEHVQGARAARREFGPGGGRKKPTQETRPL